MKQTSITIGGAPPIHVFLMEDESRLRAAAAQKYDWIQQQIDEVGQEHVIAGLTVGVDKPEIHIYINMSMDSGYVLEAAVHEALHATNCILRHETIGTMERTGMLIISDRKALSIPGLDSVRISVEGVNEERQAELVSHISLQLFEIIRSAQNGNKENS